MNENPSPTLRPAQNEKSQILIFRILWLSLFLSPLFFLVPLAQQSSGDFTFRIDFSAFGARFRDDAIPILRILSIVAIGNLALAILLPQLLTKWALAKHDLLSRSEEAPTELFFGPFIVRLALLESISLIGFVITFIYTQDLNDYLPFMAITHFFFLRYIPLSLVKIKRDLWRSYRA